MAKMLLPTKSIKKTKTQVKRFDVDKFHDQQYSELFKQTIGGRFEPLLQLGQDIDIDELYNLLKNTTNEVTQEVVGLRKNKSVDDLSREEAELC